MSIIYERWGIMGKYVFKRVKHLSTWVLRHLLTQDNDLKMRISNIVYKKAISVF